MKKIFTKNSLLSLLAIVCIIAIYYWPMWNFVFVAPQYPLGLELQIYLTKTTGDVFEIDIINHYIGMQKLDGAAQTEKALVPYILALLVVLSTSLIFIRKKILRIIVALPILGFPIVFTGIFYLWLYRFGHNLDLAAPVRLAPFTPTIVGTGIIGQFKTHAVPSMGFYFACLATLITSIQIVWGRKFKNDP